MYNRMLEQRRLREETYDYPFRGAQRSIRVVCGNSPGSRV
jgi:hypothetical protein